MPKNVDMPSDAKAQILFDAAEDRKAVDPVEIDLRGKTLMTDFLVICSGTSDTHIRAISESVQERAEMERLPRPRVEGQSVGEWILLDFGDVIVHVMGQEPRERYGLEQFWTTPQPKGALPPSPDAVAAMEGDSIEEAKFDEDDDEWDLDDKELVDAAFFDEAEQEVEPLSDEDVDLDGTDARPAPKA